MGVTTGIVVAGKIIVEGLDLPEGSTVIILTSEAEGEVYLSSEEEETLLQAMAEADRGETIFAEELFARLDHRTPKYVWVDPIVAEVRQAREALFAEANYDIHEFCRRLSEKQADQRPPEGATACSPGSERSGDPG